MITDSLLQWRDRTGLTPVFLFILLSTRTYIKYLIFNITVHKTTVNTIYKKNSPHFCLLTTIFYFLGYTQDSYWFGPSHLGYYDLCWLLCVQRCFMQWLPLSRHNAQASLGTTRFFLSTHLPHLSCMIPCSYLASIWRATLPSCITSYKISVRQTSDLPMS